MVSNGLPMGPQKPFTPALTKSLDGMRGRSATARSSGTRLLRQVSLPQARGSRLLQAPASGRGDARGRPQVPGTRSRSGPPTRNGCCCATPTPRRSPPSTKRCSRTSGGHADTPLRLRRTAAVRQSRHERGSERGLRDPRLHVRVSPDWRRRFMQTPRFTLSAVSPGLQAADLSPPRGPPPRPNHRSELADYWRRVEKIAFATKLHGAGAARCRHRPGNPKAAKEKGRGKQSLLSVARACRTDPSGAVYTSAGLAARPSNARPRLYPASSHSSVVFDRANTGPGVLLGVSGRCDPPHALSVSRVIH